MATLDDLLFDNYFNKNPSPECKAAVIGHVKKTESVAGKDIDFIKRLTVVGQNVYKSNPTMLGEFSQNYLERLYQFNHECLQEIGKVRQRGLPYNHTAHVHGHAGDIAQHLFENTDELA